MVIEMVRRSTQVGSTSGNFEGNVGFSIKG
jgi:hypothetical protein